MEYFLLVGNNRREIDRFLAKLSQHRGGAVGVGWEDELQLFG